MSGPVSVATDIAAQKVGPVIAPRQGAINSVISASLVRLTNAESSDVQTIATTQIQMLTAYYDEVLNQSKRSFTWALIAAGIGLFFFLAAVTLVVVSFPQNGAVVSVVAGGLTEVIAGINFILYGRTSSQLADFQGRLDRTQRYLLANSMTEKLDGDARQQARAALIHEIASTFPIETALPRQ